MSRSGGIASVRAQARDCRACPLWKDATQTGFGEVVTAHPSSVLRERDHDARRAAPRAIGEDLRLTARIAGGSRVATDRRSA